MPDFSPQVRLQQRGSQSMAQAQVQRLGQQQIMALKVLAMPAADLRAEIYRAAEKNPALEILDDGFERGVGGARETFRFSDDVRYGSATQAGEAASDNFQAALENSGDARESLYDHLEFQIDAANMPDDEREFCRALIRNIGADGFHTRAPASLLDKANPAHTEEFLGLCLRRVQRLDPVGTCCNNIEESLRVQAEARGDAPALALFILRGHFDFLDPPNAQKIARKVNAFRAAQKKLVFAGETACAVGDGGALPATVTEADAAEALAFIRTLDPRPTRDFGTEQANYVRPDVYVERADGEADAAGGAQFRVVLARGAIPAMQVSREFTELAERAPVTAAGGADEMSARRQAERAFARDAAQQARAFIESVEFRESTVAKAAAEIVRAQRAFFEHGPRYLAPLRQKDVAAAIGVHEATISRMANGKFLSCEWGVFDFGYFFTNAVGAADSRAARARNPADAGGNAGAERPDGSEGRRGMGTAGNPEERPARAADSAVPVQPAENPAFVPNSKEGVKAELAALLAAHAGDKKPLSDQKIADELSARGIKIARRTVAKYRAELNIDSSYAR